MLRCNDFSAFAIKLVSWDKAVDSPRDKIFDPPATLQIPPFRAYTSPFYYSFAQKIGRDFPNFFRENGWGWWDWAGDQSRSLFLSPHFSSQTSEKYFWNLFSISLPFSYFWLKYNGGVLGLEMEMMGKGWGRKSVLFRSIWVKKNDPASTGEPVDARSLYLVLVRDFQAIQICPFRVRRE